MSPRRTTNAPLGRSKICPRASVFDAPTWYHGHDRELEVGGRKRAFICPNWKIMLKDKLGSAEEYIFI